VPACNSGGNSEQLFGSRKQDGLTELPVEAFWMEMFDHDRHLSIDSVGNLVLEDAAVAAEDFIARARKQSENPHEWRRSS